MSTLPVLASKAEKGKSKYQSLDINSLYKVSRGEPLEKQQQKSTLPLKHGMQSLGKVPSARRPANLPSIKSEHSGTDAAVSLVPSGGPGWGKQETTTTSITTTTTNTPPSQTPPVSNSSVTSPPPVNIQISAHQAAIALPVTTTIPPPIKHNTPSATPVTTDKSWSSVMTGNDLIHPPPYQSPQFQHEFPSLSSGDGGPPRIGTDTQYGPGPSLRPQTEGSWMQGGSRASSDLPPRSNSVPLGPPPQLAAQVGLSHQQSLPPQYHGILPQFMYRGNFASNGHGSPSVTNMPPAVTNNARNRIDNRQPPHRNLDSEELARRPIIKEEDLSQMDDISKDMGWAAQDEIDYNQKLAFSDDETVPEKSTRKSNRQVIKEQEKTENYSHEVDQPKSWSRAGSSAPITRGRTIDEDEILAQKRRQQHQVLLSAAEKAKQRKEEEEKRYLETKLKGKRDQDETQGTISPSTVPPQPITPVPIPVPDWEKDRDKRPRTEGNDEKNSTAKTRESPASDFHQLTQIEARNFVRKESRNNERDRDREIRERNGPGFGRQLQNLPPRLQKRQQLRNNNSPQPPISYNQSYDPRWMSSNQNVNKTSPTSVNHKGRPEWESFEKERDEDRTRYMNEDAHRGTSRSYSDTGRKSDNRYSDEGRDSRNQTYDYKKNKDECKWEKTREKFIEKEDVFADHTINRNEEWHSERHDKYNRDDKEKYDRPQRPDSRDSRTSRDSRHSRESIRDNDSRDHLGSWAESIAYEDKKKEHSKEDRRSVPGPITKEKIEADEKQNEKRNLTQLIRGSIPEKKPEILEEKVNEKKEQDGWGVRKNDNTNDNNVSTKAWADDVALTTVSSNVKSSELQIANKSVPKTDVKKEIKQEESEGKKSDGFDLGKDRDDKRSQGHNVGRNRTEQNNKSQGWDRSSGGVVYNSWYNKKPMRPRSGRAKDWLGTDSDGSTDEVSVSTDGKSERGICNAQRSPKPGKKNDKDDKKFERDLKNDKGTSDRKNDKYQENKRENYEPRGEPSRHGRGGGNIRSRGGLSKRIDGYGPPPSKSPFGHNEDKDKKHNLEEMQTENISSDEKSKTNQPGCAGVIGSTRKDMPLLHPHIERKHDDKFDRNKPRRPTDNRKVKAKSKDDNCDTSDHSDDSANKAGRKLSNKSPQRNRGAAINSSRRNNPPPRLSGDKRTGSFNQVRNESINIRQNSSGSLRSLPSSKFDVMIDDKPYDVNSLCSAIADIPLKNKACERNEDIENIDGEVDDKNSAQGDSDGFQEVKSKKTGKERLKLNEDKSTPKVLGKPDNNLKLDRKSGKSTTAQLSQQQIANIPSLMDTPINPPTIIPQPTNKNQYDRSRQKLPPRFAKQRENSRFQKAQMQHGMCDVNDLNKVNQNMNLYGLKDATAQVLPLSNAWEKPLSTQLRSTIEQESVLSVGIENCKQLEQPHSPNQNNSPTAEKVVGKSNQIQDKSVLDGTTPPVNTIIFENTNFKSAPGVRSNRNEKPRVGKIEDSSTNVDNSVMSGFNKPIADLLNKNEKQADIQMLAFNKEDTADMKLDFFDSEISHLTDDKSSKNLSMPRSMHSMTSSNSTISPSAAELNFKIASVKKVWDNTMPPVIEHSVVQEDGNSSFSTSFGPDPNSLDPSGAFSKGAESTDDGHEGYSPSPNQTASNSTTNVCKVKPTQQVPGTTGQNVTGVHQHSGMISSGLMGPLSPPPIQPVIGPNVGLNQPPQYSANQHIGYQTGIGGSTQYGMSAIPSPPGVLFNSTQQLQQQAGLYGGFPIDQLSGQRGSQYSQYPNHFGLGQTGSSPYSTQSLYLQTAQHPPPTAQAPPDMYQGINNFRIPNTGPFGQNQQLNNPTTVLISSTSNSLMSATVKPSSQHISAIGTKTGGVGQTFQQQSQQGPLYMAYDPSLQANYLPSTGVMQRGPGGPVQNNVVPTLQPSSSYYSGTTGGQSGYYQQPGNSTLQSAPLQQHQAGYGLQGNVFGTHNQSHTSPGLQNFGFLSQMQLAAAMNVPQFRSPNLQSTSYMKGMGSQQVGDQSGRSQQLKSPGTQQEVLSSVFNSGPQIPSPKSRQNCKQPPPQPSPTTQHKYNLYQGVGNQQASQAQRYPTPIQRPPMNFQPSLSSIQNNVSNNQKHRTNNTNKGPSRQYYTPQGGGLTSQNEKSDDSKLGDNGTSNTSNSANSSSSNIVNKTTIGNVTTTVNQTPEISKDINKDESSTMKD